MAKAHAVPAGFVDELVTSGLDRPVAMAFAPDGRLFITEQGGAVRVVKGGSLRSTPFVSLNVDSTGERGLLGLALHPNFAVNSLLYVYHTVPGTPPHNRVTRFTASGDVAQPGSAATILDLDNLSTKTNHNGGAIHFGKDGKIYVTVGENGNPSNAQSLLNRLGKMLRINSDGSIPIDNPSSFAGIAGSTTGKNRAIWAVGLRNPFTFAIQPDSGRIFINDVGERSFEEINLGVKAANYGWPATEGPTSNTNFVSPTYSYGHAGAAPIGCALSAGTFYNPLRTSFPSAYVGKYFFTDYCSNWIYYLNPTSPNTPTLFHTGLRGPVDMTVGPEGALYYLQRGDGSVRRIRYTGQSTQGIVVSATQLEIAEGGNAVVAIQLAAKPSADVQVAISRTRSDATITGSPSSLTFTPSNWSTRRFLTISAAQDSDNIDEGATFVLSSPGLGSIRVWVTAVDNDRPVGSPRAIIRLPRNADSVSGTRAEFFGDGLDDGAVVRAEFFVDGILRYTDVNSSGHYHFGGDHNLWNTTTLSDGPHVIMMRVIDSNGLSASHNVKVNVNN
jgi:glucose/arabinose dehydrogenase